MASAMDAMATHAEADSKAMDVDVLVTSSDSDPNVLKFNAPMTHFEADLMASVLDTPTPMRWLVYGLGLWLL